MGRTVDHVYGGPNEPPGGPGFLTDVVAGSIRIDGETRGTEKIQAGAPRGYMVRNLSGQGVYLGIGQIAEGALSSSNFDDYVPPYSFLTVPWPQGDALSKQFTWMVGSTQAGGLIRWYALPYVPAPVSGPVEQLTSVVIPTPVPVTQATNPWLDNATIVGPLDGGYVAVKVENFPATQPVSGTVTANQGTSPWVDNITQLGGNNIDLGTGSGGSGTQRVYIATDQPGFSSPPNVDVTQVGGFPVSLGSGTGGSGTLRVFLDTGCFPAVTQGGPFTVTANQGGAPWSNNITQFGGHNVDLGTGSGGSGTQRVYIATDQPNLSSPLNVAITSPSTFTANNDAKSTSISSLPGVIFPYGFNGSSWDRLRTWASSGGGLGVLQVGNDGGQTLATGQVSVTGTATLVKGSNTARQRIRVQNLSTSNTVYIGASGVTSGTGYELAPAASLASQPNEVALITQAAVYAIASGTPTGVAYIEEAM